MVFDLVCTLTWLVLKPFDDSADDMMDLLIFRFILYQKLTVDNLSDVEGGYDKSKSFSLRDCVGDSARPKLDERN